MILKNIQLPAIALSNLYKYSLIEPLKGGKKIQQRDDIILPQENSKNILLLADNSSADTLPDAQLTFLSGVLSACKLSMNDVDIVNLNKLEPSTYKDIPDILKAEIIILSGIELSMLELPFKIPKFKIQSYKGKKYILIPSLDLIQNDTALKRELWELLRILFSV